jgi:hypothetical protein
MSNFLTLERPMTPRMITLLYWIAIFLIVLGFVRGIAAGVREMGRPVSTRPAVAAPADRATAPSAGGAAGPEMQNMGMPDRPGFRSNVRRHFLRGAFSRPGRFHHGWTMGRGLLGPLAHDMPPAALGVLRILAALIHATICLAVARILAEVAGAFWTWLSRRAQA